MTILRTINACCALLLAINTAAAAGISGEYLEARTCDVYTGPCFANGELGLCGKEAVMAWKVEQGEWQGVALKNLSAVLIIKGQDTLGFGGNFTISPDPIHSVILVDHKATEKQKEALIAFVKDSAPKLTKHVAHVETAPIQLKNDHLEGVGILEAGKLARIETRALKNGDCVCSNEEVFYPPLTTVDNFHPVFTKKISFQGKGLNETWTLVNRRSGFLATFER